MNEVEVVCLPKHLPEYIDLDISELELDVMLNMSDIELPEGVSIPALAQGPEGDRPVVAIQIIKEVIIEEEEELEPGEVPVEGEEGEEGEEGDEGEAAEGADAGDKPESE
jgi:large subunit ribosomal protein L25